MRGEINEQYMKEVMKKFPGTKWADLAAFHLIDNKLCGNWQGAAKCPIKEADIYEKYAEDHPESSASPEALYEAAWRWAALIEIYKTERRREEIRGSKVKGDLTGTTSGRAIYPQRLGLAGAQTALPLAAGYSRLRQSGRLTSQKRARQSTCDPELDQWRVSKPVTISSAKSAILSVEITPGG